MKLIVLYDSIYWKRKKPFVNKKLNNTYENFSKIAARFGVDIIYASPLWIRNKIATKAWKFYKKWIKLSNQKFGFVFDKSNYSRTTEKKVRGWELPTINLPSVKKICSDKYLTYKLFKKFSPETKIANKKNIENMLNRYKLLVLKPRYGREGESVKFISRTPKKIQENTIVQQYIQSRGIKGICKGFAEIRLVILNGKIADWYVRKAGKNKRITNISRGGKLIRFEKNKIPGELIKIKRKIDSHFKKIKLRFYSQDYIEDEKRFWLIELNAMPGLYACKGEEEDIEKTLLKLGREIGMWKNGYRR